MKRKVLRFLKDVFKEWRDDEIGRRSASVSFYTLLSLAPLLLIVVSVLSLAIGSDAAEAQLVKQTQSLIGAVGADAVKAIVEEASGPASGGIGLAIGVVLLIIGATGVFAELRSALNWMWDLQPKPGQGIKGLLRTRLVSLGGLAGFAFILMVSLVVSEGVSAMADWIAGSPASQVLLVIVSQLASLVIFVLLFAFAFHVLPDARVPWSDLWIGAAITAVLFAIGKAALGLYLSRSAAASSYGAAGSLVILLLWVYYSAQIFFTGAEITQVYSRQYGKGIKPDEHSISIPEAPRKAPPPEPGR